MSDQGVEVSEPILTLAELREVIEPPNELVTAKETTVLDETCRDFIGRSPFMLIASCDGKGTVDISPKGDPPGFVQVFDDTTLGIPERPGNHRADTLTNIVADPHVGLIFMIPGTKNTFRVRGTATIARDHGIRERFELNGKVPELVTVVSVTTAYFHCAKCIIRSKLWDASKASPSDEKLLAEAMVNHGDLPLTVDEMQMFIVDDEENRLY